MKRDAKADRASCGGGRRASSSSSSGSTRRSMIVPISRIADGDEDAEEDRRARPLGAGRPTESVAQFVASGAGPRRAAAAGSGSGVGGGGERRAHRRQMLPIDLRPDASSRGAMSPPPLAVDPQDVDAGRAGAVDVVVGVADVERLARPRSRRARARARRSPGRACGRRRGRGDDAVEAAGEADVARGPSGSSQSQLETQTSRRPGVAQLARAPARASGIGLEARSRPSSSRRDLAAEPRARASRRSGAAASASALGVAALVRVGAVVGHLGDEAGLRPARARSRRQRAGSIRSQGGSSRGRAEGVDQAGACTAAIVRRRHPASVVPRIDARRSFERRWRSAGRSPDASAAARSARWRSS